MLAYQECFEELQSALYRRDVLAAAHLIGGGCSDDGFTDFRAGVIAEGRTWYERVAADPDSLAGHPLVVAAAGAEAGAAERYTLFHESVNYAAPRAFERLTGDEDDFYEAWEQYGQEARPAEGPDTDPGATADTGAAAPHGAATDPGAAADTGEAFDVRDAGQMHRRLPRLAALFLPGTPA